MKEAQERKSGLRKLRRFECSHLECYYVSRCIWAESMAPGKQLPPRAWYVGLLRPSHQQQGVSEVDASRLLFLSDEANWSTIDRQLR